MKLKIIRNGQKIRVHKDIYYWALNVSWFKFLLTASFFYLALNAFFASLYYFLGDSIINANPDSFWDAYMFSFQTSSTLGYGYLLPKTNAANIIVIFDSLSGLLYVALTTGLIFSKFSKATHNILFSKNALIVPYDGIPTLMFRIANGRETNILNASLSMSVLSPYTTKEGFKIRRFHDLKLVSNTSPLFSITWLVMHQITEDSPFYGLSVKEIRDREMDLIITFTGLDSVMAQSAHINHSYKCSEIVFAKKFEDIISIEGDTRIINLDKFHNYIL